jgi:cytochrome c-type biogenesis protein CcmE
MATPSTTWEKTPEAAVITSQRSATQRYAYGFIGIALIGVIGFLLYNAVATGRYYMTVNELLASPPTDSNVRVAGAVLGDTIHFDQETQILTFTVAHVSNDAGEIKAAGGLGAALHFAVEEAANNPNAPRLEVVWHNAEMPDLLQNEAQAIMTGTMGEDGKFYADEVLLKCPTRYSDEAPKQTVQN